MPEVAITRLKPRPGVRPVTLEEALFCWYLGGANADGRLSVRAKMLLHLLCGLASGEDGEDLAAPSQAPLGHHAAACRRGNGGRFCRTRRRSDDFDGPTRPKIRSILTFFIPPL